MVANGNARDPSIVVDVEIEATAPVAKRRRVEPLCGAVRYSLAIKVSAGLQQRNVSLVDLVQVNLTTKLPLLRRRRESGLARPASCNMEVDYLPDEALGSSF